MRKQNITSNKGVTATSSDIAEASKSQMKKQNRDGIQSIKEELENVIELMGPSTPHLISTSTTIENNDESMISTSIYSSLVEVKKKSSRKEMKQISADTPRDLSELSALPIDISETTGAENVGVRAHNVETCPCRQYYNTINALSQNMNINAPQTNFESHDTLNLQKTVEIKGNKEKGLSFLNLLKFRRHEKELPKEPLDLYKINILHANDYNIPQRLTFDLIHDLPRPDMCTIATNTSKVCINSPLYYEQAQSSTTPIHNPNIHISQLEMKSAPLQSTNKYYQPNVPIEKPTRVDVYYFDHGNSCYLKTTDMVPSLTTEMLVEKTEEYTTRFWAEIFGTIHIAFAFVTTFVLQLLRFILQSFIRPLTIGLMQLTSDYFFKPCLTACFNAIIQPPAIFLFNILTSLRDLCDPIAEGIGYFLREVAHVFRSIRLIEVKNSQPSRIPPLRRPRLRRKK